ncbi:MAG: MurR/RpiR family transcriptional regulator [Lachnospiraceae bacterium]|nr:MurR/RpiR family transcriptional regulator [Lachnospiraceae bacterium]
MADGSDLFRKINENFALMSKGRKAIARFINKETDTAAFMTAAELGEACGVSESTVVRFAMYLGFEGYPEFQNELSKMVRGKLVTAGRISEKTQTKNSIIKSVFQADVEKMNETLGIIDEEAFSEASKLIQKAKHIYIVGIKNSAPVAMYIAYYLKIMRPDVNYVSGLDTSDLLSSIYHIGDKDCLIGVSFPRYSVHTLRAMEYANERNAGIIALTDSEDSPCRMYSHILLCARTEEVSIAQSMAAPMSLATSLVAEVFSENRDSAMRNITGIEEVYSEYGSESRDDLELVNTRKIYNYPEINFNG